MTVLAPEADTTSELSFDVILEEAEDRLWSVFRRSTRLRHRGTKGRVREEGVARFLREQLPDRFAVHEGEAMDVKDRRSTQLDVVVFDGANVSPLWIDEDIVLIPAESLLAVIEVKTRLTRSEYTNCARAVRALAELEPNGQPFIPVRKLGAHADDDRLRCLYSIVAFETDLGTEDWAQKEGTRFLDVCAEEEVDPSRFDRILVLGRGLLVPPHSRVREVTSEGEKALLGRWFLHLSQFLTREVGRRPPFEWTPYRDQRTGWTRLKPEVPELATAETRHTVSSTAKKKDRAAAAPRDGRRRSTGAQPKQRKSSSQTSSRADVKRPSRSTNPSRSKRSTSAPRRRRDDRPPT